MKNGSQLKASKQQHKEKLRNVLLDTAAKVIAEKGIRFATMDNISAALGLTKIILYRSFGSRDKLIHSVLERVTQRLLDEDNKDVSDWRERIYRNVKIAREHTDSFKILLLQTPFDQEYQLHFNELNNVLVNRTKQRLTQVWGNKTNNVISLDFCSEGIVAFILDSIARWLKVGDEGKDDEFVEWLILSIEAMSEKWTKNTNSIHN